MVVICFRLKVLSVTEYKILFKKKEEARLKLFLLCPGPLTRLNIVLLSASDSLTNFQVNQSVLCGLNY